MKTLFISPNNFYSTGNRLLFKMTALLIWILCFGISPAWGAKSGAKLYVNASAAVDGDGMSWETAFTDLQDALASAVSGDQIWVAAGTYKPTKKNDRSVSFILKSGVKIYGGFAGGEKQLHKRHLDPSLTVLSGDIGTIGDDTDNSFHVVFANGVTDAVLDGFTVTRGRGDEYGAGAGMYTENSALTVANCIFSNNKVAVGTAWSKGTGLGGAMYNKNSAPIVTNCTFSENQAGNASSGKVGRGGAMYNEGYFENGVETQSPVITGCTFSDNVAFSSGSQLGGGGGMYNVYSSPTIDRCTFLRNLGSYGGGMYNTYALPTITNCIFNTNSTTHTNGAGGAIYNAPAGATILNCTFYQNGWRLMPEGHPSPRFTPYNRSGGAIYDELAGSTISNCIFMKNAVKGIGGALISSASRYPTTLTNCLFYENIIWWPGYGDPEIDHVHGSNIESINNLYDIDPLLMDPAGGDFRLRYDSPCIDAGHAFQFNNEWYTPYFFNNCKVPATDFEGNKRIVDGDGDGAPAIDIGANEFKPNLPDLRAFLQALADSAKIDEATGAHLLAWVDAALAETDREAVTTFLNGLIVDAQASLGGTETGQVIVQKAQAVIEEID